MQDIINALERLRQRRTAVPQLSSHSHDIGTPPDRGIGIVETAAQGLSDTSPPISLSSAWAWLRWRPSAFARAVSPHCMGSRDRCLFGREEAAGEATPTSGSQCNTVSLFLHSGLPAS